MLYLTAFQLQQWLPQTHRNVKIHVHCLRCSTYCHIHHTQHLFLPMLMTCHMHSPQRVVLIHSAFLRFSCNSPLDVRRAQAADCTYPEIFLVGIRALLRVPGDPHHFCPVRYPPHTPSAPSGESLYPTGTKCNCDTSLRYN
jgi:hypothetical protein